MAYSTIVFGNETEAVAFAEKNEYGTKDIKAIAEKIAEIPLEGKAGAKRMVIITQGEIWAENNVFPILMLHRFFLLVQTFQCYI